MSINPTSNNVLKNLSAKTKRECKDIKKAKTVMLMKIVIGLKTSKRSAECFDLNDPNIKKIIERDLFFSAPLARNEKVFDVLKLNKQDKERFKELTSIHSSFTY